MATGNISANQGSKVPAPQNSETIQSGGDAAERPVSLEATGRTAPVPNPTGTGEGVAASSAAAEQTDVISTEGADQA